MAGVSIPSNVGTNIYTKRFSNKSRARVGLYYLTDITNLVKTITFITSPSFECFHYCKQTFNNSVNH